MLSEDIDLVNDALVCRAVGVDPIHAWERIKTKLMEVAPSASDNSAIMPVCPHYECEKVLTREYIEMDICKCKGKPAQ